MAMIKMCISCTKDYESPAKVKNKRGVCKECRNKKERSRYARNRIMAGKGYCDFDELMSRGLKKCTKCEEIKPLVEYSKRGKAKYRPTCKRCDAILYKDYEIGNKARINENRRKRRKDPIKGIVFSLRERQQSFFKGGKRIKCKATTTLLREWLGCSVENCKGYLELKFSAGMNWSNRGMGKDKWQIDHKIPISLTELGDGQMLDTPLNRKIWHYSNLQPLWHPDNARKADSLIYLIHNHESII